jgi:tetratricopeptide (TPR) repeat protein
VAKSTTQKWIINGVLAIVTLSFLGLSIAPLITGLLNQAPKAADPVAVQNDSKTAETERLKIQAEGFEAVLKREPKNETALKGLVDLRLRLRDFKGTIEPLQTLADANPQEPKYRKILARAKFETKDRVGAIAEYRKILTTNPGELESLQTLVSLELEDKKPEAAIGYLTKALETADTANKVTPDSVDKPAILWILGNVYIEQKRFSEAIASFDKITAAAPKDFRPLVGKAQIKRIEGKETEAKTLFAAAAKLAPPEFKDRVNELAVTPQTTKSPTANPSQPKVIPADPQTDPNPVTTPNTPVIPDTSPVAPVIPQPKKSTP